ncbi:MAG: sulfotransferase family 2 domain-containing protein, partial [Methylococcales bacterium]
MIVSHKYRFIFIKTVKTAGTSIETYLSGWCGDEDIVTPVDPPEPGHRPRNHAGFYNHMPGQEIRTLIGVDTWSSYFKFCFERNPWDKMVSWYFYWKTRFNRPAVGFQEFLQQRPFPMDFDKYAIDGKIAVDFIGQYEHLLEDFRRVCGHLGIPVPEQLPHPKDS